MSVQVSDACMTTSTAQACWLLEEEACAESREPDEASKLKKSSARTRLGIEATCRQVLTRTSG